MTKTSNKARPSKKAATPTAPVLVKQGAKFGVVGISNTVIDYVLYIALTRLLNVPIEKSYLVKFVSGTVAMINSFYWNRRWTFQSKARIGQSGVRFVTATLVSIYAIQPGMVFVFSGTAAGQSFGRFWFTLAQVLGVAGLLHITDEFVIRTVAFGMGVLGSAVWNFTLYKLWAFRED